MEQMERIIGHIGTPFLKNKIFVVCVALLVTGGVLSGSPRIFGKYHIDAVAIIPSYDDPKEARRVAEGFYGDGESPAKKKEILEGEFFEVYGGSEDPEVVNSRVYSVEITNEKGEKLWFDYSKCITGEFIPVPVIAFFEGDAYVDMIVRRGDPSYGYDTKATYWLFRFDFVKKEVNELRCLNLIPPYTRIFGDRFDISSSFRLRQFLVSGKFTDNMCDFAGWIDDDYMEYKVNDGKIVFDCRNSRYEYSSRGNYILLDRGNVETRYRLLPKVDGFSSWFFTGNDSFRSALLIKNILYSTKTALEEGDIVYLASNMRSFSNKPWAVSQENVYDEEIVITSPDYPIRELLIGNGFYDNERQHLFLANNRVKEILIQYDDSYGMEHRVILQDTGVLQLVPLLNISCNTIRIKILSVYPGEKYDDTCINFIGVIRKPSDDDWPDR